MSLWHPLVQRVRGWMARVRTALKRVASSVRTAKAGLVKSVGAATRRHRERAVEDTAYARTIATAVSELVTTMVPRPTLATIIAVALAGLLGHPHQPEVHSSRARDPYRSYGTGSPAVPPAVPGSLWDRLQ